MSKLFEPKLFTLLKSGISKEQLVTDIFAGIVVGIVALPLSIAFAVASGVSPEKGLITAIVAGFIISFLGGSRVQIGGPTGAFIVILYAIVEQYGVDGLMVSTMMAGVILIVFWAFAPWQSSQILSPSAHCRLYKRYCGRYLLHPDKRCAWASYRQTTVGIL